MSRRRAREAAMQAVFQMDFNPFGSPDWRDDALCAAWAEGAEGSEEDFDYSRGLFFGVLEKSAEIDRSISALSREWKVSRMAFIDRAILRLAVYEMRFASGMPPGIVINEAVELAKKFGTEKSGRFVNGILGAVARELGLV